MLKMISVATQEALEAILRKLPPSGETKFPAMSYEQGIEELALWLLNEISDDDFEYSPPD